MTGMIEKVGENVGERGDLIEEGLKKVTCILEDMAVVVGRVDARQEIMMKEIKVLTIDMGRFSYRIYVARRMR